MSVKTKKRVKNIGKIIGIALFALLMFTNIKIATMDSSELASGDISLFGIEITLFDATDAYGGWPPPECNLPCYYNDLDETCTVYGELRCIGAFGCPAERLCHFKYN